MTTGSFSLTAVNAFTDPRAAWRASSRLAEHGFAVVSAERFRELAPGGGSLAIIGGRDDHDAISEIVRR